METLRGRVAFVTGGSSGIGLGIAHAMLRAGMKVALGARDPARLDAAVSALARDGAPVHAVQVDVSDREQMRDAAEQVERALGHVHVLCNNTGAGIGVGIAEATHKDWAWAIGVNLLGVVNGLEAFLPRMLAHGEGGHVVSTASMAGLFASGKAGVYSATKYAVVGMMEALRAELAPHGIGVSVYCPGVVDTRFHESEDSRPVELRENRPAPSAAWKASVKANILSKGMSAQEAGEHVVEGIRRGDLFILSHPEYERGLQERFDALLAAIPRGTQVPPERAAMERALGLLSNPIYTEERERRLRERGERHSPAAPHGEESEPCR